MKIGILTFHNIPNTGAILQAFSLCYTLRNLGYECEIIDYQCNNIIYRELTYHPHPNIVKDFILRNFIWPKKNKKIAACQMFMKEYGMYSREHYNKKNIFLANEKYDIFLSGSDMIWDFSVTDGDKTYLLDFVNNNKLRYSYGSSCGDGIWSDHEMDEVLRLLRCYKGIAVREKSMKSKLHSIGIECKHVADPTMLIEPAYWNDILEEPVDVNYVLVYFPSEKILAAASDYAKRYRKKVIVLNWGIPKRRYKNVSPYNPKEWIGYFRNADAIFTNSYHGLLFSLYFKKPVWVGKKGSRFDSIIDALEIEDIYLSQDRNLECHLDYNRINYGLERMRKESLNYLRSFT